MVSEFWKFIKYSLLTVFFVTIGYNMLMDDLATPKSLGEECCECWKEANKIKNETKRVRKTSKCYDLTRDNQRKLQEMGIDKDWTNDQVLRAEKEFDAGYEICN